MQISNFCMEKVCLSKNSLLTENFIISFFKSSFFIYDDTPIYMLKQAKNICKNLMAPFWQNVWKLYD